MPAADRSQGTPSATGGRPLQRGTGTPLWSQLLTDLYRRLEAGEFVDVFPGELELEAEYHVSRHTVREALRRLRAEGIVSAARGRRSKLREHVEITQPLGALYSLFQSVEEAGLEQASTVRALDVRTDGVIAARLHLAESTPLLFLERIRLAGGDPLALDRVWLPAEVARPLLDADFSHTALYTELAGRCGVQLSGGQEQIHAVLPTEDERALLDLHPDIAAFAIDRLGYSSGEPIEWRHTVVRGDRFSLTAESSVRTGYRLNFAGQTSTVAPRRVGRGHGGRSSAGEKLAPADV